MRILRKASKKLPSSYLSVDEDREDVPLTNEPRFSDEVFPDDSPAESVCGDSLRSARRYKNRVFPSLRHKNDDIKEITGGGFPTIFEDTLAVALASPSSYQADQVGSMSKTSIFCPPDLIKPSSVYEDNEARDPADTGSVTSLFLDDSSSLTGCDNSDTADFESASEGCKIDSFGNLFPDDPAIWNESATVTEERYGVMSGAISGTKTLESAPTHHDSKGRRVEKNSLDNFIAIESPERNTVSDDVFWMSSTDDHTNAETVLSSLETTTTVRNVIGPKGNNPFDSRNNSNPFDDKDELQEMKNGVPEIERKKNLSTPEKSIKVRHKVSPRVINPFDSRDDGDVEPMEKKTCISVNEFKVIEKLISVSGDHGSVCSKEIQAVFTDDDDDDDHSTWSGHKSTDGEEPPNSAREASVLLADDSSSFSDTFVKSRSNQDSNVTSVNGIFPGDLLVSSQLEMTTTLESTTISTGKVDGNSSDEEDLLSGPYLLRVRQKDDRPKTDSDEDSNIYYDKSSSSCEELHGEEISFDNDTVCKALYSNTVLSESREGSDKLMSFEDEEGSTVEESISPDGCTQCSELEEKIMILQAQHRTELLMRDLQDEEILKNMALMREYIEQLESDTSSSDPLESDEETTASIPAQKPKQKSELEQKLLMFDEELEFRSSSFKQGFDSRMKEMEDENDRLSAALEMGQRQMEENKREMEVHIEKLQNENERLSAELSNNQVANEKTEDDLEVRLKELESENDRLSAALSKGAALSEKDKEDVKFRIILELEEERDMLITKIEAQQASVTLMTEEEEQLKMKMHAMEKELQYVLSNSHAVNLTESGGSSNGEKDEFEKLKDELQRNASVRISQEEMISMLVQQVNELSTMGANKILLHAETNKSKTFNADEEEPSNELALKIRALELERNQLRSKCISQQRVITKMQHSPGSLMMPPIQEHETFDPKSLQREENFNESNERKHHHTPGRKKSTDDGISHQLEYNDVHTAKLQYLEQVIKSLSDSDSDHDSKEGDPCVEEDDALEGVEQAGLAARWKDKIRSTILSATNPLSKKSKEEDMKRGDGIFC